MLLANRTAIVTGGGSGIGRGTAVMFAKEGARVAVTDINPAGAKETLRLIEQTGGNGLAIQCDATNAAQVHDAVALTLNTWGKIDILVNNAGGLPSRAPVEEMSEEEFDRVVALNLKSAFLYCKNVVPAMKKAEYGRIINISSLGATQPPSSNLHYHSGKAGVLGLTRDLAVDLAAWHINVNAIIPGPIRTGFFGERQHDDIYMAELGKTVPLGRVGTPEDIAGTALFLASELSSFITGEFINVTGGLPLGPTRARPPSEADS
jgi:NAD(P)-dependent dehydrogenase (short-subunit alcohol dehydrogenase family)